MDKINKYQTRRKYNLRYLAELSYFDETDTDYIHLSFKSRNHSTAFFAALDHHNKHYKAEKAKINVIDTKHPEHGEWIVESQIIKAKT